MANVFVSQPMDSSLMFFKEMSTVKLLTTFLALVAEMYSYALQVFNKRFGILEIMSAMLAHKSLNNRV